jgi:pimeloyl-ACP methyl ester carboxylesterase
MELNIKSFKAEDGAEIKYVDEGCGVPLVYIYGMGSSIESQLPFIQAMREKCRVVVFDQRAFGLTAAAGEMGIHQSAHDARTLMRHLGIEKAALFGYSMGAAAVFSYLEQFGCDGLSKVIIGDMSPKLINEGDWRLGLYQGWYTREMYERDLELIKTDYKRFALILSEQLLFQRYPEEVRDFSGASEEIRVRILGKRNDVITEVLLKGLVDLSEDHIQANYHYWTSMASADFRPVLKKITVPVALLYADPGSGYCPATAEYMHSQIPVSTLMPVSGCTHMAAGEKPLEWRKYISDFISG